MSEPPPPTDGPAGLLLVAHGSRVPGHADEVAALAAIVAGLVDGPVGHGFLERSRPDVVTAGERLLAGDVRRLVIAPLLLFAAHHATTDVPAAAAAIRARRPDVVVEVAAPLGPDPRLLELAASRVGPTGDPRRGLLVVSSGTSDAGARQQAATVAAAVAARCGHRLVGHAFASVAEPDTATALRSLLESGATGVTVWSWSLFDGRLVRSVRDVAGRVAGEEGVPVRWAGRLGPDPVVATVVAERFRAALATTGWRAGS